MIWIKHFAGKFLFHMKSLGGKRLYDWNAVLRFRKQKFTDTTPPNVWQVPFSGLSPLPRLSLGHWKGTCIDTCKAFRPGEKAPQPSKEIHFLKQSPIHPNTSPPSYPLLCLCFQSYTTGGKLSLIERGNNSESLQPLISNQSAYSKKMFWTHLIFFLWSIPKHTPWQFCFWIKKKYLSVTANRVFGAVKEKGSTVLYVIWSLANADQTFADSLAKCILYFGHLRRIKQSLFASVTKTGVKPIGCKSTWLDCNMCYDNTAWHWGFK